MNPESNLDPTDADRFALLDRIAERIPELDLEQQSVEWITLEDGHEGLLVNGGGLDGGDECSSRTRARTSTVSGAWLPSCPRRLGAR